MTETTSTSSSTDIGADMILFDDALGYSTPGNESVQLPRAAIDRLRGIHARVSLRHGSLQEEFPEQLMAAAFLSGGETVLEIGGNVGRNSVVIASLLSDPRRLVTLETDPNSYGPLCENRDLNGLPFHAVNAALSARPLIQMGWNTLPAEHAQYLPAESVAPVSSCVTFAQLEQEYALTFDTLVLDCEGAFFYILQDFPDVLTHIRLVIMENDYWNIDHMDEVDRRLREHAFECVFSAAGGWGPCKSRFYEVWRR